MSAPSSATSASKPSPTTKTKPNRLPAPTLFVGPPSRNASQISVSRQGPEIKSPQSRQKNAFGRPFDPEAAAAEGKQVAKDDQATQLRKPSEKSVDIRWREMQSTLNEVELTAKSSTHVFGESHAAALDELRRAQVELARAWGRGNEEKDNVTEHELPALSANRFQNAADTAADRTRHTGPRKRGDTDASVSTTLSDESVQSENTVRTGRSQLEDETAEDIRLASERRAANEAYFKKVDGSVKEVVAKLEVVAEAMRGVEGESRSLWSSSMSSSEDGDGKRGSTGVEGKR